MFRATLKGLLAKKLRLVLTALSIVLGVAFVAGTYVLTDTMSKAFDDLFTQGSKGIDVVVQAKAAFSPSVTGEGNSTGTEGRKTVSAMILPIIRSVSGVKRADGDVFGYAQMIDPKTDEPIGSAMGPPTLGANWRSNTVYDLRSGRGPQAPDEVAVDAFTAQKFGLSVGNTVRIQFVNGVREFTVVGTVGYGDSDNLLGATLALFDLPTAQDVLDKRNAFDAVNVIAEGGVSATELRNAIALHLPEGVEAITAADQAEEVSKQIQQGLGFFKTALLVFAGIALFVGAFIIFNTFSIIVAQRTRELGLLRALGASRRQVLGSVLAEAVLVGLVASAIGVLAGLAIAVGLQGLFRTLGSDLPSTGTQLLPRTIIVSLVVGTGVTLIASIFPARRAARIAPVEALRESDRPTSGRSLRRRLVSGSLVLALGVAGLVFGLFGEVSSPARLVGLGAALTFIGIAMLLPFASRPIARALGAPLPKLGTTGKLGRENAMRNPRRTASTASALMIGLGLMVMVTVLSASLKASTTRTLERTLRADLILTTSSFGSFSPDVATRLRSLPEVVAVTEFRMGGVRVGGGFQSVVAVSPETILDVADLKVSAGSVEGLHGDGVMVHRNVAEQKGWRVGDEIEVGFPATGEQHLKLVGIYDDKTLVGADYMIGILTQEKNFTEHLDADVLVKGREGVPSTQLKQAVEGALGRDYPNIEVQDQAAFREKQARLIDQLLVMVNVLLGLAVIIALFGVVNTLSLSIYERTRELGLLRAVGMTRRQVRRMVRWEAMLISVLGAVLGLVIGVSFGWALQRALADQGVTVFAVPPGQLVSFVVFAAVAGVFAAIFPAFRASRLNVLEAIAYE